MTEQIKSKQKSVRGEFYKNFIKTPQGYLKIQGRYSDFIKFNDEYRFLFLLFGEIPANTIKLYHKPDFKAFKTCEQMYDWLENKGSYQNLPMNKKQYRTMIFNILIKCLKEEK